MSFNENYRQYSYTCHPVAFPFQEIRSKLFIRTMAITTGERGVFKGETKFSAVFPAGTTKPATQVIKESRDSQFICSIFQSLKCFCGSQQEAS